jgi:predicted lipoprotein with Yx(FWY)xxD motif
MMRAVRWLILPAVLLLVAGCGGGSGESEGSESSSGGGEAVVVTTKEVPGYGVVLANQAGRPLYLLSADPKGGTKCVDDCAKSWPPVTGGKASADGEAEEDMLSTFKRPDGTQQVSYNGHALYTNTGEELAGIGTKGQGGAWYLVSPKGEPVKTTEAGGY